MSLQARVLQSKILTVTSRAKHEAITKRYIVKENTNEFKVK
jgi:hypothetical protein